VPALAERLCKGDSEARLAILRALENIGRASVAALPKAPPLLSMVDPRLRADGARFIGQMGRVGPEARAYLPALQPLLYDPDREVRRSASGAIIAITDKR